MPNALRLPPNRPLMPPRAAAGAPLRTTIMPTLTCEISESLMQALVARSAGTGEPVSHIVMTALADVLEVEHSTLFQVSTSTALVKGVYDGVVTLGELKRHGDFGLGTFDGLDGEMVAVDGHFYRVRGRSGEVTQPPDDARLPFAVVTSFHAEREAVIDLVETFDALTTHLDRLRRTENLFCAVRLEGHFTRIRCRAICKATAGESLVDATSHQSEFTYTNVAGTLVGFWSPSYARSINIAGWHLHFLTADRTGGGHLLDCQATNLRLMIQDMVDVRIAMPETAAFLQADLSQDPSKDLEVAEHSQNRTEAN
jgi:acetolactate decarboxylase